MQEKNNNSNPLGICHKLFNFIIDTLIAKGFKRITLGHRGPTSHDPTDHGEPVEGLSTNEGSFVGKQPVNSPTKPDEEERLLHDHVGGKSEDHSGSEITVEFKHRIGLEYWTAVDNLGYSVHDAGEAILGSGSSKPSGDKELPLVQENIGVSKGTFQTGSQEIEPVSTSVVRERGLNKSISIKGGAEEKEKEEEKKEKSTPTGRMTVAIQQVNVKRNSPPPRHVRPLLSVAPNINEKSDEFIRRRKEAMRRNYIHETKAS